MLIFVIILTCVLVNLGLVSGIWLKVDACLPIDKAISLGLW